MAVVRIDLEINSKGEAVIASTSQQFKSLGATASSAGEAIKRGFLERIGGKALDAFLAGIKSIPGALVNAVSGLLQAGGAAKDLEARTGLAAEAQSKLAHAGKLVGVTMEQITPAIGKMQQQLVDAPEKFARLGLSVEALRRMKPEEQFAAIAERIGQIEDPAERSAAAIEIFGKAGTTLLPLLTSDMKAAMEQAEALGLVMSSDVVY